MMGVSAPARGGEMATLEKFMEIANSPKAQKDFLEKVVKDTAKLEARAKAVAASEAHLKARDTALGKAEAVCKAKTATAEAAIARCGDLDAKASEVEAKLSTATQRTGNAAQMESRNTRDRREIDARKAKLDAIFSALKEI